MDQLRVGFIGAGKMANAVAQAILLAGRTRSTLPSSSEAKSPKDNFGRYHGFSHRKLLRSQAEQLGAHHPGGQLRLFRSQNHVESQSQTSQDAASHLRSPGMGSTSYARSTAQYPKTKYWRPDGDVKAVNIFASAPSNRNLEKFQTLSCRTTHSNLEVLQNCSFVFLATKPHILPTVLHEIAPAVTPEHVFISMAAGVTLETLEERLPAGTKVIRIIPNLPCVVQSGAIILSRGSCVGEKEVDLLKKLLSPSGLCEEAPESYIDIHTGLSGSGVAYVYMFAEALAEGAVKMGMPGPLANKIAAQTLLGAAKMMLETGEHPAALRSAVCTPGGTTIHALHELEKGGLRATVMNAVEAATNRAREMGKR
ncbi:pyrroline-5-carboxylate reductase 3 isoform X2 [Anolis carolinensis]|uniref:Pyrroline-5-carboxylate reductase n=1 Tax=Anolis carolinensis TaxID=28377 RepID=A0A803TDC2_ANOCA|nr:PREDICTED: pyrroline-5-carboxylate reductase 3 isoform X1 [Anolis carolinensis]|eukprot:XP_008119116.1 PREDICTED: pyrroline-5-carboxylate reductase 3 isoform X1 [Anolis carolinensis]